MIVLLMMAAVCAALTGWMFSLTPNLGQPVGLVCIPASLGFAVWAYTTWAQRLEVRQRGVRLTFATCKVEIRYNELESFGKRIATVNGTAQDANGIWFQRIDGKTIILPLSTRVDEACVQIATHARAAAVAANP